MQEMPEIKVQSQGQEDPLVEEMATCSSILAWKILWTEESGGLQSMGSQTFGHNWVNEHAHMQSLHIYHLYGNFANFSWKLNINNEHVNK